MLPERVYARLIKDPMVKKYARTLGVRPDHLYKHPETYVSSLLKGKKPPIAYLPEHVRENIEDLLRNGTDPETKGRVGLSVLVIAASRQKKAGGEL